MGFDGLRVLSLESRRAKEMETLIRREGGDPFIAPSVQERALDDNTEALEFIHRLSAKEFDLLICMTGAGLAFLKELAVAKGMVETLSQGMRSVFIVSRGPKPVPILREFGAKAHIVVPEPNTWKEVVDAVALRPERRVAVQEYGRPNLEMTGALEQIGAAVTPFAIYRWELPADTGPLREAVRRLAARSLDIVLFTSSVQLDHLFEIAREEGLEDQIRSALKNDAALASVGPVMTTALEAAGLPADIVPEHPKMAAIVKAAAEQSAAVIERKRNAGRQPLALTPR